MIVLRDNDGAIRAMSNVCLHRMSTLLTGTGRRKVITCPYHAWTYDLDGTLRERDLHGPERVLPPRGDAPAADPLRGLARLDLHHPEPGGARRSPRRSTDLAADIAPFGMEGYTELFRETHVWDTNWKVLAENFMESYHLPACHAATIGGVSSIADAEMPEGAPAYNIHFITKDPSFTLSVAHPDNTTLEGEWRLKTAVFAVYPSLMITLTPGYFWYLSLHPKGPGQVHITFGGGLSPDFLADPDHEAHMAATKKLLDEVNDEDKGCTERVFRGVSSRLAAPGPMSHLERPLYDFSRYLADRLAS